MNIKLLAFKFLALYLSFTATIVLLGGFTLSKTFYFVFMFWLLSYIAALSADRVRSFFLMPTMLPIKILIHSALMWGTFWICDQIIGGITIHPIQVLSTEILGISIKATTLGSFGTIAVVSVVGATLYQTLIWLQSEK